MTRSKFLFIIISSIWMMLLMGTVYSYSIFRTEVETIYQLSTLESGLPYMFSLLFYALSMMMTGRFLSEKYIRSTMILGTMMIIFGFIISSLSTHFLLLILGYGILIGTGVGMVYGIPIYIIQRSHIEKKGLYTGLVLLGFGLSPLITAPIGRVLLVNFGLSYTFLVFALIFAVTQLPLGAFYKLHFDDHDKQEALLLDTRLKHKFYILYGLFIITTAIGLMMIGLSYQAGAEYYLFNDKLVTLSLSIFAICNGFARPLFGYLIDRFGLIKPSLMSLSLIAMGALIGIFNQGQSFFLYVLTYGLFWFNLGAWLSIMPSMVKTYYGSKHYAKIYGMIFTAYGLGAIISTLISGSIIDALGDTLYLYISILGLLVFGYLFIFKLKSYETLDIKTLNVK